LLRPYPWLQHSARIQRQFFDHRDETFYPEQSVKKLVLVDAAAVVAGILGIALVFVLVRSSYTSAKPRNDVPAVRQVPNAARFGQMGNVIGRNDAPIRLIEFSDFQCPFCRQLQTTLRQLQVRHPETVAIIYRHYPLAGHGLAYPGAIAAECAAAQGRFGEFVDLVFDQQDSLGRQSWGELAIRAGVRDSAMFQSCRRDASIKRRIDADIAAGRELQIAGTPALIVGTRLIFGALSLDTLERLLGLSVGSGNR
jgi:protein-disulfide isomerase